MHPTLRERIDKYIVGKLIKAKINFGLGHPISKQVAKFTDELAEELHNPVNRRFEKIVDVIGIDAILVLT